MELAGARVLVTGGTGFLGRNVVRELEAVSRMSSGSAAPITTSDHAGRSTGSSTRPRQMRSCTSPQ